MNDPDVIVQCVSKTTLHISEENIVVTRKEVKTIYPISKIQSFSFVEATLYNGGGIISFTTSESADSSLYLGFGVSVSGGAKHSFGYKYKELENAKKLRDIIEGHLNDGGKSIGEQIEATQNKPGQVVSVVDEIRGLKALLDDGILTRAEFDAKKKQLLGI